MRGGEKRGGGRLKKVVWMNMEDSFSADEKEVRGVVLGTEWELAEEERQAPKERGN